LYFFLYLGDLAEMDPTPPPPFDPAEFDDMDKHFNWKDTEYGFCIVKIRNQKKCGGCWSFALTEMMGDRFCIDSQGAFEAVFSPQYLIDCVDETHGAHGCQGADTCPKKCYYSA
jgi:hypothetical protein